MLLGIFNVVKVESVPLNSDIFPTRRATRRAADSTVTLATGTLV
jgi:hypothetical protein